MSGTQLILYKMGTSQSNSTMMIVFNLKITYNFSWSLHYFGEAIDTSKCTLFKDIPLILNDAAMIKSVLDKINSSKVCVGNPDTKFDALVKLRQGFFKDQSGALINYMHVYTYTYVYIGSKVIASTESRFQSYSTIRHVTCEVLLPGMILNRSCAACVKYRKSLNTMLSRHNQQLEKPETKTSGRISINSHANYRYLSSDEKNIRLHSLQNALTASKHQIQNLKDTIDPKKNITILSEELNDGLLDTMKSYNEQISKDYSEHSFPYLFWQQQMQAASVKDSRSMKWHPLMIKWCLYLQHKSSGGYELVRDSGQLSSL